MTIALRAATLPQTDPGGEIAQAILAANYAQNGVHFAPFMVKGASSSQFNHIWISDRGDTAVDFYQFNGQSSNGFLPLGDVAIVNRGNFDDQGYLLFAPSTDAPDALAHPTDFTWVLNDHGSGNDNDVTYWRMTPPAGYAAVGLAFSNDDKPDVNNYWCVKLGYLRTVDHVTYWNDSGSHWSHNGDMAIAAYNGPASPDEILLLPQTLMSFEDIGNEPTYVLAAKKAYLDVAPIPAPVPVYDPENEPGSRTDIGVKNVAIVPASAIADPGYSGRGVVSPFYYVANQRFYTCTEVDSTPGGGAKQITYEIGTSQSDSTNFKHSTSLTVGAEVGVELDGFSAGVSTSFTEDFSIETQHTSEGSTSVTDQTTINIPGAQNTQFWQRIAEIRVFRTDTSVVSAVDYGLKTLLFTQSPTSP
ncbi:MAG: Vps62-related protein [Candidatus Eremiobacteraeota bacterium]|nr:Vps62-related protein [Candidatus Eremiobacteraeota bacterium]